MERAGFEPAFQPSGVTSGPAGRVLPLHYLPMLPGGFVGKASLGECLNSPLPAGRRWKVSGPGFNASAYSVATSAQPSPSPSLHPLARACVQRERNRTAPIGYVRTCAPLRSVLAVAPLRRGRRDAVLVHQSCRDFRLVPRRAAIRLVSGSLNTRCTLAPPMERGGLEPPPTAARR